MMSAPSGNYSIKQMEPMEKAPTFEVRHRFDGLVTFSNAKHVSVSF